MNCFGVSHFSSADNRIDVEITLDAGCRPDADAFISQFDVQRIAVSLGIDGNCLYSKLFTGPDNPNCDFTPVGNQNFMEHATSPVR